MKITKRLLAITLVVVMLFAMSFPSFAVSENDWAKLWSSADAKAGIIMFVGSSIDAVEGSVVNKVTVTDLKEKGYDVKFSDFYR